MKVLFINTVFKRGSTGRIVADLGQMLEENGHDYKVAYGRGNHSDDPHCYRVGNDLDMYIHAGLSRITDRAGFYSKNATKKLVEFIREYEPDIIHLHNLHGYYLNVEVLFNYLADEYKGRVIWTLHDCWSFTGHCVHYTYAKCDKWKTGCSQCSQKREYPASLVCDRSARNYDDKRRLFTSIKNLEIITVSKWLMGEVQRSYLKNAKIECIYNGIDTEKFHYVPNEVKKELGIEDKKMILLVSDGWIEQKGYSTVLSVAKIAPQDWQFVMIGLTKKQIATLPKNITGLEHVWNQDKLVEFYSAADVYFNPSLEETFGLVTAEAIACGTPAVVMNSTACPEVVRVSKYGKIVDCNSKAQKSIDAIYSVINLNGNGISLFFVAEVFLDSYKELYFECKDVNNEQ